MWHRTRVHVFLTRVIMVLIAAIVALLVLRGFALVSTKAKGDDGKGSVMAGASSPAAVAATAGAPTATPTAKAATKPSPTPLPANTPEPSPTDTPVPVSPTSTPVAPATPTPVQPMPTPVSKPMAPPVGTRLGSRLGIWMGGGDSSTVQAIKDAGARWTRVILNWSSVEPTYAEPAVYDFAAYDSLLADLARTGITPVVAIHGNPGWAAETRCGPVSRVDRFAGFVRALVAHYKDPPITLSTGNSTTSRRTGASAGDHSWAAALARRPTSTWTC